MESAKVMVNRWFLLLACFAYCAVYVCAQTAAATQRQDGKPDDISAALGSLFGFKPCVDESCRSYGSSESDQLVLDIDYEAQEYEPLEPEQDASNKSENPQIHCIILRPSAVKTFGEIEGMHPGLSDIKYKVLEDLISHMHVFSTLKLENCNSHMKLVDLVILAANSLKTQYVLQGEKNCTYRTSTSRIGLSTPTPVESYPPKAHEKPKCKEQSTEKPYLEITEKPCSESISEQPHQEVTEAPEKPCTGEADYQPDDENSYVEIDESVEISDEQEHLSPPFIGSVRGIPGIHYPNYTEIPISSFTCADKKYIPGFYADLETGCQVFHVCYEHRRESFLCPLGTIFNQPILACDYWYSSNCSLASSYYKVNEKTDVEEDIDHEVQEIVSVITSNDTKQIDYEPDEDDLDAIAQFLPVKAKVVAIKPVTEMKPVPEPIPEVADVEEVASDIFDNIMVTATKVTSKTRDVVRSIPEPSIEEVQPIEPQVKILKTEPVKLEDVLAQSIIPVAKAKLAAAALPVSKVKASIPVVAKAKLVVPVMKVAAAKAKLAAAVPVVAAKAKLAAAVPVVAAKAKLAAAVPVVAAKATVPVVAAKAKLAAAVPVVAAKAAVPVVAAKAKLAAAVPVVAAKAAVPVVAAKAKLAAAVPVVAAKAAVPVAAKVKMAAAVPVAKVAAVKAAVPAAKVATAKVAVKVAVPVAKVAAAKVAVPVAKVAAAKVAVPVAKAVAMKVAVPAVAKSKAAIPVVKGKLAAKAVVPAMKTKMLASAVPIAKAKLLSPVLKGKIIVGGKAPLLKTKMMALPLAKAKLAGSVPLAKVKLAKAAAISPLTKKALAVGYMKLLKAKKLALMG